jgi:DNA-binding beta-propeller fold protein YncE
VNRLGADQIDRELGRWLLEESQTRAPAGLVEDVFARTSRTPQVRRWWPRPGLLPDVGRRIAGRQRPRPRLIAPRRTPAWPRASALAGTLALVAIAVALGIGVSRSGRGPGSTTSPAPSLAASPSASPAASPSASTRASASPPARPSPEATTLGSFSAQRLDLGPDAAPIAVTEAFGSIWVADIHANDVRRYEPGTLEELARIPVPGAAWFAQTGGALWVTSQTGTGLTEIDPHTSSAVTHVGDDPPCGAPVYAFGDLWQAACDADVILRIDSITAKLIERIPARGHGFLVLVGDRLITVGPEGLAGFDPLTKAFTAIGGPAAVGAEFVASDGTTVWVKNSAGMARLDPADGHALAGFPYVDAQAASFSGDHAWLTVRNQGVVEIDLATNEATRTIPVGPSPLVPFEAGGALWVTDFEDSALWRIALP